MAVQLSSLPHGLQTQVVQQRHFLQALSLALTGHEESSMAEAAEELRAAAANAFPAVHYVKARAGDGDWQDCARVAAIQSLAAATGASLLDGAAAALRRGERQRLEFVAQTKRALGRAQRPAGQSPAVPASAPGTADPRPAPVSPSPINPSIAVG